MLLFVISLVVNVGMWLERFVIVVTSLHRDFLPSSWGMYYPTFWDCGDVRRHDRSLRACMFLFIRFLPMISMHEVSHLRHELEEESAGEKERVPS